MYISYKVGIKGSGKERKPDSLSCISPSVLESFSEPLSYAFQAAFGL